MCNLHERCQITTKKQHFRNKRKEKNFLKRVPREGEVCYDYKEVTECNSRLANGYRWQQGGLFEKARGYKGEIGCGSGF